MLNLVRETVASLGELWPGCNLRVLHLHELPKYPAIKLNLPIPDMKNPQMVLGLLKANNPDIPVSRWSLVRYGKSFEGRIPVVFRVDEESIQKLALRNNEVVFCMRSVLVCIEKNDSEEPSEEFTIDSLDKADTDLDISCLFDAALGLADDKHSEEMEH